MPPPEAERLPISGGATAILYRPRALAPASLVLVHGLTPLGQDDPKLQQAARLLAQAGFWVAVPTVPGLVTLRFRPEDVEPVVAAIQAVQRQTTVPRVAVIGVSVGAGPALLAAADPRIADRVGWVLSLGGYASTAELLRFFLTGQYRFGSVSGTAPPNPEGARLFLHANLDLIESPRDRTRLAAWLGAPGSAPPSGLSREGAAIVALMQNRDPARVEPLIEALPSNVKRLLDVLSPERVLPRLKGRLILVHGRSDPAVPFTESLRLADAARQAGVPFRLAIVGAVQHVEAAGRWWDQAGELAALWGVTFDFLTAR